ncbi:uncharacterized protein (DUF885 family) [Inhella inkyongensis]|uniref:Uncharacterized protein (DUF885 family) n=1 Tax=Inhella inkyongensis TaxID=392593 RepID=A0A840S371_9BURK|nr:DUF885 domain-containing protein [Inhella inkyongensis]MBB5204775.1 uncharacterized protein (DUF885 family) [Inhella inkyongensis]
MLAELAERYFQQGLELNPQTGSQLLGEARFEGRLGLSLRPEHRARDTALQQGLLRELQRIDPRALQPEERITHQLLRQEARDRLALLAFPEHLLPINQYGGLPVQLAEWASGQSLQPFGTAAHYRGYLARLRHLPAWVDQAIANLREGQRRGIVVNRALLERGLKNLRELAQTDFDQHPYSAPLRRWPAGIGVEDQQALTSEYRHALGEEIQPALRRLVQFLDTEHLPHTRQTAGLGALPGGKAWYAERVRQHTTTALTPDQVHRLGLQEVARLHQRVDALRQRVGYAGDVTAFLADRQWRDDLQPFRSEAEILDAYRALNARIAAGLPALFERFPKAALAIQAEPEISRATASDHYEPPAMDGSRPGIYYAVIQDPREYERQWMVSLLLHEAQPGHHFQMASQQELDLPQFRKHLWFTAYGEGWALYTETLGYALGLYQDDPVAELGHLKMALHRAIRLVVDTGLHHLGWSREQTIDYIRRTEGAKEDDARRATERYMADPGQALGYMVGALKIQALRERAEKALGARFSLPAFHTQVLRLGCVPLDVLEREIGRWIKDQAGPKPRS